MSRFYSPSTKGFYPGAFVGEMPEDVIEITEAAYDDLLTGANSGKVIVVAGGAPALKDAEVVAPTVGRLRAYAMQKADALLTIPRSYSGGGVTVQSDASSATIASWFALGQWASIDPAGKTVWVANDGSTASLNPRTINAIAPQINSLTQQVYQTLANVLEDIANGKIDALAQVDAAAWPAVPA